MPGSLAGNRLPHEVRDFTREIVRCNSTIDPLKTGVLTAITVVGVHVAVIIRALIRNRASIFRNPSFHSPSVRRS
ncbi:MAG: hypothetical protein M3Z14_03655 [Candidatus Eremiobacteraeota bacterium]|nr:hypothetical protein [Candidatus Eremiobacteraeota bacterium]